MRKARILVKYIDAGLLEEIGDGKYRLSYHPNYLGPPISLTMPLKNPVYEYTQFPPFFEGLLPEGTQLEALLIKYKLDRKDYFGQLMQIGDDLIGAITVEKIS